MGDAKRAVTRADVHAILNERLDEVAVGSAWSLGQALAELWKAGLFQEPSAEATALKIRDHLQHEIVHGEGGPESMGSVMRQSFYRGLLHALQPPAQE